MLKECSQAVPAASKLRKCGLSTRSGARSSGAMITAPWLAQDAAASLPVARVVI